jgi:predicted CoA-substrate-specific enzyme activase
MSQKCKYLTGIDIGSTTAKVVILNEKKDVVFSRYYRHYGKTLETIQNIFTEALTELNDIEMTLAVTGSAGMGIANSFDLPFIQEVVASAHFIKSTYPKIKTFIEIGGEDSKIIYFNKNGNPDIKMNGNCAGGTGAFIDQMAILLDVDIAELNLLAEKSDNIYPIASRCGVFAKTDVQALLSQHISREDIAASIFHSVALQVIGTLSQGQDMGKEILISGGPLTFYSSLRKEFSNLVSPSKLVIPDNSELIPALGTAMVDHKKIWSGKISHFLSVSEKGIKLSNDNDNALQLTPLFKDKNEFEIWEKEHQINIVQKIKLSEAKNKKIFLGIDSGSTTTKIVLIDEDSNIVFSYYTANNGNPMQAVKNGLNKIKKDFSEAGFDPVITRSATTGYGENLIKSAFGLEDSVVETISHYKAAQHIEPDVSFILDIGGQDMKAIYIQNNTLSNIQVNEACSSGCGSFLETFANSMGYDIEKFSEVACFSNKPFDLGTRCTVFMNSKVRQAIKEGVAMEDIASGLAYSVVKNALYKVLKIKNTDILGDKIVVQGGTFKNSAVLRALEILLEKDVLRSNISELMGAYGAALTALENYNKIRNENKNIQTTPKNICFENMIEGSQYLTEEIRCRKCENQCRISKLIFNNGNHFYTGNRCERSFNNNNIIKNKGKNFIDDQIKLLFERNMEPENTPILTYGIPRCLNIYENFPFWCTFLTKCGFKVVLSSESNFRSFEKGSSTVMSENICFPAKLSHSHIFDLSEKKIDRIFYPTVVFEQTEYKNVSNAYNCPVITGYPDLLKSAINPEKKFGIPLDNPAVSFKSPRLLKKQLYLFFKKFGIKYKTVSKSVKKAIKAQAEYKKELKNLSQSFIDKSKKENRIMIVLCGRPYHIDPFINHGIPELLTDLDVDVISEAAVPLNNDTVSLESVNVLTQWSYTNRLYAVAKWVKQNNNVQLVQITSFGCGPDAVSTDEIREILHPDKIYTLIKIDENSNLGAIKIRLRSMLETVRKKIEKEDTVIFDRKQNKMTKPVKKEKKILIAPFFSPFYSPLMPFAFKPFGYQLDVLPPQDKNSIDLGLKTVNNDMCYPALLVTGDIIKAFQSGKYNPENTAVLMTQTGGQCRASSYVPLIKKAMTSFGLDEVPIIALSTKGIGSSLSELDLDKTALGKRIILGIIFSDPLARMYLSVKSREKNKGTSKKLYDRYLTEMQTGIENADFNYLLRLLKKAVTDFNSIEIKNKTIPKIGIVGEIFVKYNLFASENIIDWLTEQEVEVILPPIQNFFAQFFINEDYDQKTFFKRSLVDLIKYKMLEIYSNYHLGQVSKIMQNFHFYRKDHDLRNLAETTSEIVSLANQFGEGWLLTAEMIAMLKEGISNIICLQPFGCISNHITGKGIENALKDMFPDLNLLSLDMDSGTSEVNIMNRLYFMLTIAKKETS